MSKQGSSLIETMVAMVLLIIIALSSAFYFAIPPFRKEARRFAALERAAGMLDLISVYHHKCAAVPDGYLKVSDSPLVFPSSSTLINKMKFSDQRPQMGYTVKVSPVTTNTVIPATNTMREVELVLYDDSLDTNSLFATFKMLLPPAGP